MDLRKQFKTKQGNLVTLFFRYCESCQHVYKKFNIFVDGKKKNITWARKNLEGWEKNEPDILTINAFFWSPNTIAVARRNTETKRVEEVGKFFDLIINLNQEGER